MISEDQKTALAAIIECASQTSTPVFVVGGLLRDLLLGHTLCDRDIDIVTVGNAHDFVGVLQQTLPGSVKFFQRFLTAKLSNLSTVPSLAEIDVATARTERYAQPGALPEVKPARTINEDLQRRDFAVNAIACPIDVFLSVLCGDTSDQEFAQSLIDPFDGRKDLLHGQLRVLHAKSFIDDPTRLFRGLRYCVRLGGAFEESTEVLFREAVNSGALRSVSESRVLNELRLCLAEENSHTIVAQIFVRKLFEYADFIDENSKSGTVSALAALDALVLPHSIKVDAGLAIFQFYFPEQTGVLCSRAQMKKAKRENMLRDLSDRTSLADCSTPGLVARKVIGVWASQQTQIDELLSDRLEKIQA